MHDLHRHERHHPHHWAVVTSLCMLHSNFVIFLFHMNTESARKTVKPKFQQIIKGFTNSAGVVMITATKPFFVFICPYNVWNLQWCPRKHGTPEKLSGSCLSRKDQIFHYTLGLCSINCRRWRRAHLLIYGLLAADIRIVKKGMIVNGEAVCGAEFPTLCMIPQWFTSTTVKCNTTLY